MKKLVIIVVTMINVALLSSFLVRDPVPPEVAYPTGYRNWAHMKTTMNKSGVASHTGFQHIYANEKAIAGYAAGKFAEGSVFVFDVLETKEQPDGNLLEGKRKLIDVMVKDSSRYPATGGWGFEEFKGDSKTERVIKSMAVKYCYSCHANTPTTGYVFSKYRE